MENNELEPSFEEKLCEVTNLALQIDIFYIKSRRLRKRHKTRKNNKKHRR